MKKLFYLVLIIIAGCVLHGDNQPRSVVILCDPNPEDQNVTSYEFYFWHGDDTTTFSISLMEYKGAKGHALTEIKSDSVLVSYNYMRAGAIAVNIDGQKSSMGLSRFYSYFEFFPPSPPENVAVNK